MEENPNNKSLTRRRSTTATRRATTSCDVPWDIIINILSWLPVKSLMRFRCVCKSWQTLFSDPKFIGMHLNQTRANNKGYVLSEQQYCGVDNFSLRCGETFVEQARLEPPFKSPTGIFRGEGHCNGLLCLSCFDTTHNKHDIFLWNPSIRKFKVLPHSFPSYKFSPHFYLGFGFVPQIDDYKVVKFIFPRKWNGPRILPRGSNWLQAPPRVEMYSLRTNSWKDIQNVAPCMTIWFCNKSPVVNGVVLWLAGKKKEESHSNEFILSFDMANEVFSEIKLPECFHDVLVHDMYGMVESLSLFVYSKEKCREEIWVMKKYGAAESWSKQYTFEWMDFALPFLGSLKNGELVVKDDHDGKLIFYDPRVQQVKDVRIHGIRGSLRVFTCYMESLVLLNEGN